MSSSRRRGLALLVRALTNEEAKRLAADSKASRYLPGWVVFYRDHQPLGCYLLKKGSVSLELGHGRRMGRGIIVEGPALLGSWYAEHRKAFPATVRAVTEAELCHLAVPLQNGSAGPIGVRPFQRGRKGG